MHLFFLLTSLFFYNSCFAQTKLPQLSLFVGETYGFDGVAVESFHLSKPDILSTQNKAEGFSVKALRSGQTTLSATMGGQKIELPIEVKAPPGLPSAPSTFQEIRAIKSLKIETRGSSTVLTGEILNRKAYQTVLQALHYNPSLQILATISPGIKASLMEQARSALRAQGLDRVQIAAAAHRYFLYGSVVDAIEVEQAYETVKPILATVENKLPIPIRIEPTIHLKVYILEINKRSHKELGISWPQNTRDLLTLGVGNSAFRFQWDANLRHLATSGVAKILAEPELAVKLGSEAELSAGGEIPIKLTEKFENKLVWKHYGLKLKVQIPSLSGKFIRTKIETETSHLDAATSVGGTPGIRNNTLKTEIDAEEGKPVLLTGLIQSSSSKDIEKLPILGDIPIIGELFKSRDFRNQESELMIALLPRMEAVITKLPLKTRYLDADTEWSIHD